MRGVAMGFAAYEDAEFLRQVLAYVTELYEELTQENGAPPLGTQNQAVELILADPGLRAAVARWAKTARTEEATTRPLRRLPQDAAYGRVRDFLERAIDRLVFAAAGDKPL
jgi:predicted component of type VI protein secretion system